MKSYIQILGTCNGDSLPSILLFLDNFRFIFNCGEGLQRFCVEHKVRLAKTNLFFISNLLWERLGGLPGTILTLSEVVSSLKICAPKNFTKFMSSTRYFLVRFI
eukprot:TRINITY_DN2415_c0_g4_i2.p1 TRINITY_DN2415_c0_g4~~TRINITY_DN2415_c0_g4_i2.p1  ORF type:complete len:104 (+),score=25.16 TRINITY_DN2415_c0_g4_i2:69-380(+)